MSVFKEHFVTINKAIIAGIINSIIGYIVIFGLIFFGVEPILSNVAGYAVGLTSSFYLNKYWVINNREKDRKQVVKFALAFGVSYSLSLIFLYSFIYVVGIDKYLAQFFAGLVYFVFFFTSNKLYVFR